MRLLANYGCRSGAESFNVTMEMYGDVDKEQVGPVVDNLFTLAKAAVQRQINSETAPVKKAVAPQPSKGNGGNGNGKDNSGQATDKQMVVISRFLKNVKPEFRAKMYQHVLGKKIGSYSQLSRKDASLVISSILENRTDLLHVMSTAA